MMTHLHQESRASVVSSYTIIRGPLIDESLAVFRAWDSSQTNAANFRSMRQTNPIGAQSTSWLREVISAVSRRFDPNGRDKSLVTLAKAGCPPEVYKPILLWHMTRDEFLVRDFLIHWLWDRFVDGVQSFQSRDLLSYLQDLENKGAIPSPWAQSTRDRVAASLLRIATEFGLLTGHVTKEFASYHLPDEAFLYLLYVMSEKRMNVTLTISDPDWRMFRLRPDDVEASLFRLHQFRKLHYEVAGSLAQLTLPYRSALAFAREVSA